jgi:tRNA modification GTPase
VSFAWDNDTIAAVATPAGEGGISVVRISGDEAIKIADRNFRGRVPLIETSSHTAHYGRFLDERGETLDQVVAVVFRKPHSYTGEDTIELSCHGGQFVTQMILEAVIRSGARPARPGEFTKRSFLNGRMDLAQAEAVADLIHSRSERAHQSSLSQLGGGLSRRIGGIRDQLIGSIGQLELELDFAEEGYEFAERSRVADELRVAISQLDGLLSSYRIGRVYRDGVKVALAGAPNVGKSSLLNALLMEDRAIVTSIPGTTRDVIEESITLGGLLFTVSDTAGLRETANPIEREGIRRAEEKLQNADILVVLLDTTRALDQTEIESIRKMVADVDARGAHCVVAMNKTDLPASGQESLRELKEILSAHPVLEISAKTLKGLDKFKDALISLALQGSSSSPESNVMITNARHFSALDNAKRSLVFGLESLCARKSNEFVVVDLRSGLDSLGEIIGVVTTEEILNTIFSRFCIGK